MADTGKGVGRTIGRRDLKRRLNQLAAGVTLRYVEERFGTPAFTRAFANGSSSNLAAAQPATHAFRDLVRVIADPVSGRKPPTAFGVPVRGGSAQRPQFRELVYREKHARVQFIIDQNDAVARFSITVTDPKFRFATRELTCGHLPIKLGHSHFSEVADQGFPLDGRSLRIGAHNREYAEAYWFGNPGQYQRYVIQLLAPTCQHLDA